MSDGISEGYRATRAYKSFEELWEKAQVEHILLDMKSGFNNLSAEDMLNRLMELCARVDFERRTYFVDHNGFRYQSVYSTEAHKFSRVVCYRIEASAGIYRTFEEESLRDVLSEALLFAEWCKTDEGKRAKEIHDDY